MYVLKNEIKITCHCALVFYAQTSMISVMFRENRETAIKRKRHIASSFWVIITEACWLIIMKKSFLCHRHSFYIYWWSIQEAQLISKTSLAWYIRIHSRWKVVRSLSRSKAISLFTMAFYLGVVISSHARLRSCTIWSGSVNTSITMV